MTRDRLTTAVGSVRLKNPVICGSGEHVMTEAGIRAAVDAGAGAVVAKSFNETQAGKDQLDRTEYALIDSAFSRLDWDFDPPSDATLACRSGLIHRAPDDWIEAVAELDREARSVDALVVASIILADLDHAVDMARRVAAAGIRVLEFNIGTPYGDEAGGVVSTERAAARVRDQVAAVSSAIDIPVWAKLTGQSEDVAALAGAAHEGGAEAVILMGRFLGMIPDPETMMPMLGTNLGIGGRWSLPLTCYWLARTRTALGAETPLIATNGVRDGEDVVRCLLAGAHAAELSTAVMTGGFHVLSDALASLGSYLERHDTSAQALVGVAADRLQSFPERPSRPGSWKDYVPPETLA